MNSKVVLVIRIIFGLFILTFGANKFYEFLPPFEGLSEAAAGYFGGLASAKVLYLVGAVEVLSGLSLLFNKYNALMMVILMSVSVNAVLFHATLDPGNIVPALGLLILNIVMLYVNKEKYAAILKG